jgi:hypothetical protein
MGDHKSMTNAAAESTAVSRMESNNIGDVEKATLAPSQNLVYDAVDKEPSIQLRTWVALAAMFMMNFVQTFALQGPPSVVSVHSCLG